ncbi:MAG: hypothetical protein HC796_04205, partial [Synechococcaceae cyanobacterium RL_1_2]|nr:hypothetical protein [Synechococcaceae cyanobacterium RL_1_2]
GAFIGIYYDPDGKGPKFNNDSIADPPTGEPDYEVKSSNDIMPYIGPFGAVADSVKNDSSTTKLNPKLNSEPPKKLNCILNTSATDTIKLPLPGDKATDGTEFTNDSSADNKTFRYYFPE